jgi:RHS repeat-associated protein
LFRFNLEGAHFGTTGIVTFTTSSGTVAVSNASWSDTSITVTVPSGAVTGGVFVTVPAIGLSSNVVPLTVGGDEEVVYYHTDAIGSARLITGAGGLILEQHDYLPFGEELSAGPNASHVGFAGSERDAETGNSSWVALNYLGARNVHSASGRFTSVDPAHVGGRVLDPQTWNAYAYAGNNPLRFTDPDGLLYQVCVPEDSGGGGCQGVPDEDWEPVIAAGGGPGFLVVADPVLPGGRPSGQIVKDGWSYGNYHQTSVDPKAAPLPFDGVIQGVHLAAPITDPRVVATWYAASAFAAYGAFELGAFAGDELITMGGRQALTATRNGLNKLIGDAQRRLLDAWFKGEVGPEGISRRTLELYKEIIGRYLVEQQANATGISVQMVRLAMIERLLEKMR